MLPDVLALIVLALLLILYVLLLRRVRLLERDCADALKDSELALQAAQQCQNMTARLVSLAERFVMLQQEDDEDDLWQITPRQFN